MNALVIGVGNAMRGDDGAGLAVARALAARVPPGVRVMEASGEGAALMDAWRGAGTVLLVDAARSGAPPGTIHRFDAVKEPMPARFFHYSTHAFSVAEAVELARVLGALPPRLLVYGIEGRTFEAGAALSSEVARAVADVTAEIARLLAGEHPPAR
ncbi:hydrogenase maturation protease [Rhodocaloribacter sp.]